MNKNQEKLMSILEQMGYETLPMESEVPVKTDEKYTMDLELLKSFAAAPEQDKKYASTRHIYYKDEYHNEEYTQVQATLYGAKTGLGTVKQLAQDVIDRFRGKSTALALKPEFIYLVVPAIEIMVESKKLAAGGLVRPEELRRAGLDPNEKCVCAIAFIVESFKTL